MTVTIYHNPRCSKSRKTLELLREHDIEPDIIEYLKTPPTKGELDAILTTLGLEPRDLMRHKEAPFKELGLDDPTLDRDALIDAIVSNPILMERPVVLANGKAAIGRPPESVLGIV